MRRRFDVRDYTVFYVGRNGQISCNRALVWTGLKKEVSNLRTQCKLPKTKAKRKKMMAISLTQRKKVDVLVNYFNAEFPLASEERRKEN